MPSVVRAEKVYDCYKGVIALMPQSILGDMHATWGTVGLILLGVAIGAVLCTTLLAITLHIVHWEERHPGP
ncbi:MAG: hypothetical protein JWN00_183 [Actinomycetia bacterium]|nr:hypothetical protein [Actinomycetes bacterium]